MDKTNFVPIVRIPENTEEPLVELKFCVFVCKVVTEDDNPGTVVDKPDTVVDKPDTVVDKLLTLDSSELYPALTIVPAILHVDDNI